MTLCSSTVCLLDMTADGGGLSAMVIFLGGLLVGAVAVFLILWRVVLPKLLREETEDLADSIERMKDIFDSSADGMVLVDKDMTILSINEQQSRWFPNAEPGKLCYKEFRGRDQDGPCESCPVQTAMETGKAATITVQGTDARGKPRWHQVLASPLRDRFGRTIGAVEMVRNVTDLKLAEMEQERLHQHLEQTHEMMENVSDSIIGSDRDRLITIWNKGAEQIFGYTAKEVKGNKAPMLYPESEHAKMAELAEKVLAGETIRNVELAGLRKDGSRVQLLTTLFPVKNAQGEVTGISGISKDITERKRLEDQIRSQKEIQDNLIENANVIIIGCSVNNKLMIFNKKAEKSTGYPKHELLGTNWIQILIPGEKQEAMRKIIDSAGSENFPTTCECPITTKVGIRRQFLWHNSVLRDKTGSVSGVILIGEEHPNEPISAKLEM